MDKLKIRPKNFGVLSSTVFTSISGKVDQIKEIALSDSTSASTQIVEIDLTKLLHSAVMGYMSERGVTKGNSTEDSDFMNGLNVNLDAVEFDIVDGRLRVHVVRDDKTTGKHVDAVRESLKPVK